jgi:outer membrane protein assembly factor BamD (BamD/ComL family)
MQKDSLKDIGEHPLGELRMGLADVYRMLGRIDESRSQLEAVVKELPNTDYSKEADKWLAAKPTEKLAHNCIGCHSK